MMGLCFIMANIAEKKNLSNDGENSLRRLEAVCDSLLSRLEGLLSTNEELADCLYQMKAIVVMLDAVKVLSAVYEKIYDGMKDEAQQELVVCFENSDMGDFCC